MLVVAGMGRTAGERASSAGFAVGYDSPPSSAASTAACSAHRPAATRARSARPPRRCQPEHRRGRRPRPPGL